jgi:hypothetical protein
VSKTTDKTRGKMANFEIVDGKIIPSKATGGVPTSMVPYHNSFWASVSGTLPVSSRLRDVLMTPEKG